MAFDFQGLLEAVASYAGQTGVFERVAQHEPKSRPGSGMTCAAWFSEIAPLAAASGLDAVSGLITVTMRPQLPFLTEPADEIDPRIMSAVALLMAQFAGGFTLAGVVRNVDLLGQHSQGLRAQAGYLSQDKTVYRVMDVHLPLVVNDLFPEAP